MAVSANWIATRPGSAKRAPKVASTGTANPTLIVWAQRLRSTVKSSDYSDLGEDHAAHRQASRN